MLVGAADVAPVDEGTRPRHAPGEPFWAGTAVSATHCGAGCVLGDLGLFGWMAIMQVGMIIGFVTTYPVNWWLMRC